MLDICSTVQERLSEGYITSPNYPDHYPTNVDCLCTLETDWSSKITLSFYDLLLETKQGAALIEYAWRAENLSTSLSFLYVSTIWL